MMALILLPVIVVWLMVNNYLSNRIYGLLRPKWRKAPVRVLLFLMFLILPVVDEIIGYWQFNRICQYESAIYLSDDWKKVKRARSVRLDGSKKLSGYATRIEETEHKYQDLDTGRIFLKYKSFRNYGGLLLDKAGLRMSAEPPNCRPINVSEVRKEINLQKLLDQGEFK